MSPFAEDPPDALARAERHLESARAAGRISEEEFHAEMVALGVEYARQRDAAVQLASDEERGRW